MSFSVYIGVETIYGVRYSRLNSNVIPSSFMRSYGTYLQTNTLEFYNEKNKGREFQICFEADSCSMIQRSTGNFCVYIPDSKENVKGLICFAEKNRGRGILGESTCKTRIVNFCGTCQLQKALDKEGLAGIIIEKKKNFGCIYEISSCKNTIGIKKDLKTLHIKGAKHFAETMYDLKVISNEDNENNIPVHAHMMILSCGHNRNIKISDTCLIKTYFNEKLYGLCTFVMQHDENPNRIEMTNFDFQKLFEVDILSDDASIHHSKFIISLGSIMDFTCAVSKNAEFLFRVGFKKPVHWSTAKERYLKDICGMLAKIVVSISDGHWKGCVYRTPRR